MSNWTCDVPILDVVSRLGYDTFKKGGTEYGIKEGSDKTAGRGICTEKNIAKDFSGKGRPDGNGFGVVMKKNNFTEKETFGWFEENFPNYKPLERESIRKIFFNLPETTQQQKDYLLSRGIEFEKVKSVVRNYNGSIGALIYKGGLPTGVNARTLSEEKKNRFVAMKGYPTDGVYMGKLDKEKDYLFVVEGLIDFLTIYQYDKNVIGLKSAESGVDEVNRLSQEYNIIFINDNDEAGEKTKEKLQCKYSYFNRSKMDGFDCKDVNDIHKHVGDAIVPFIQDNTINETPILKTIEKFLERQKIIKEKGKLGFDGPFPYFDHTSGVVKKKVYGICAFSNTGKSKFAYSHCAWFLQNGHSCLYISIEESEIDIFQNIACAMENKNIHELSDCRIDPAKYQNLVCLDTTKTIEEIDGAIKGYSPDIVFIDYAQGLQAKGGSAYEKNATIAYGLQQLAIQNDVALFVLHQVSNAQNRENSGGLASLDVVSIKGAGEYFAASDVLIALAREEDFDGSKKLYAKIVKNKLGIRGSLYEMKVDYARNQFKMIEENQSSGFTI